MKTTRYNPIRHLQEEHGFTTLTTAIYMMLGLAMIGMLVFTPYVLAHTNRRSTQTGADSGSLAAAGLFADRLSVYWPLTGPAIGECGEPFASLRQRTLLQYYQSYYRAALGLFGQQAYSEASSFSGRNKVQLSEYNAYFESRWYEYTGDIGIGSPLEPIVVSLEGQRQMNVVVTGANVKVPAGAAAVTYFHDMDEWKWMIPKCGPYSPPAPVMYWKFSWLRSLVDPR